MNLTLSRADLDTRKAAREVSLPQWVLKALLRFAESMLTSRLDKIALKMSREVLDLLEISRSIDCNGEIDGMIDVDGKVTAKLDNLRRLSRDIHKSSLEIKGRAEKRRADRNVVRAAGELAAVCSEYYDAITKLHWVILEHDADNSPRINGFLAETSDEVGAMLDRISSGE